MGGRPRLLFLVTTPASLLFVRGQVAALTSAGFDVDVATNCAGGTPLVVDGVVAHDLPFERQPAPWRDLVALWHTVRLVRRVRPDLVHAGTPKAALLGVVAAWIARAPVRVYAVHGLRYETITGRGRRFFMTLEQLTCAAATHVLPDSRSLAEVIRRDGIADPGKVSVVGPGSSNGLDTRHFSPQHTRDDARSQLGLHRDAIVIGFVGRLTHDKGVDDLVQWYRTRTPGEHAVQLLVVGPHEAGDPIDPSTRRVIDSDPDVIHIDWLDDPRVAYTAMDLLAFPSYREGLPNVPLEAQSMGVPVVGYRATGTVDAVPDPMSLVPVGDTAGLAMRLDQLIAAPGERDRIGAESASWVRGRFDRSVVWDHKIRFFTDALRSVGRGARAATPR